MSSKPIRCSAMTNKATKCKKTVVSGQKYCLVHYKILADCVDVGQKEAIHFSQEDQGPGLIEDAWTLIAGDFTIFELRPLLLTCKTLFRFFTSEKWYGNHRHRRYLLITKSNRRPFVSDFQDEVSKKIGYVVNPYGNTVINDRRCRPCLQNNEELPRAIFVVDSYLAARKIYRCIKPHGKQLACSVAFDASSVSLPQHVLREFLKSTAEYVYWSKLHKPYSRMPAGHTEIVDASKWIDKPDTASVNLLVKLVVKKFRNHVGYTIQGNIITFKKLEEPKPKDKDED